MVFEGEISHQVKGFIKVLSKIEVSVQHHQNINVRIRPGITACLRAIQVYCFQAGGPRSSASSARNRFSMAVN